MEFQADWDSTTKATTGVALAIWAAAALYCAWLVVRSDSVSLRIIMGVAALPALMAVPLVYLWSPRSYRVTERSVEVTRPIGSIHLPVERIQRVEVLEDGVGLRRDFGSGGLFGVFGQFSTKALGRVTMYGTRNTGRLVLHTSSGPVVVTPSDVGGFMREIERLRASRGG